MKDTDEGGDQGKTRQDKKKAQLPLTVHPTYYQGTGRNW